MNFAVPNHSHKAQALSLTIELANICNLRCGYCLRDEDALHHSKAQFFPLDLLRKIIGEAQTNCGLASVSFTGGEPTLHPNFSDILSLVAASNLTCSFVTNGWHFDRIYKSILAHRQAVEIVAFSLDGATAEAHDRWRGQGSFARVMSAITRCFVSGIPFALKVGIRRDTVPQLEAITLLAARLGAVNVQFSHLLPTSSEHENELALSLDERTEAECEIGSLNHILKIPVGITIGSHDTNPGAPCPALAGTNCNVDYRGRLTLCCNLSGYRGTAEESDVAADLTQENFTVAFARLQQIAAAQNLRRQNALVQQMQMNGKVDLYTGSPCLFCLQSFGKIPWQNEAEKKRSLPVLQSTALAVSASSGALSHGKK